MSVVFGAPISLALAGLDSDDSQVRAAATELMAASLLLSLIECVAEDSAAAKINARVQARVAQRASEANARRLATG